MAEFSVSAEIAQPQKRVWDLFNYLPGYEKWNPFIVDAVGTIRHRVELDLRILTPSGVERRFRPRVESVKKGSEVVWSTGSPLFSRQTTFRLHEPKPGVTLFTIDVKFRGLLAPWRKGFVDQLEDGYRKMAEALKERAESGKPTFVIVAKPKAAPVEDLRAVAG